MRISRDDVKKELAAPQTSSLPQNHNKDGVSISSLSSILSPFVLLFTMENHWPLVALDAPPV
jgi:hypothetical protein